MSAKACQIPNDALLSSYYSAPDSDRTQAYTDCYTCGIEQAVTLADFAFAFYCTPIFRLERFILKYLVSKPSTDQQARQLADGLIESFAAWQVEKRTEHQLLMCDFQGRTRSWFMVKPDSINPANTALWFGSAVVPRMNHTTGKPEMGGGFNILLGFHKLYSVILLNSARQRLLKTSG